MKDYRRNDLSLYLLALLAMIFINSFDWQSIETISWQVLLVKGSYSTVSMGISYVLVFVLTSLIPSDFKMMVLFGGRGRVPGNVVISKIISNRWHDLRLNSDEAVKVLKDKFPDTQGNDQWYKLYVFVKDEPAVWLSNKDFLFSRDLAIITGEVFILYTLAVWPLRILSCNLYLSLALLLLTILSVFMVHVLGKRFVLNVVVLYLREKEKSDEHN
ncbi:hypothetical protein [Secundilactobacillus kimchicus]|uniref:hypothetical protein n=1 Tax=Secundilactobacillus kimchicus TaxID=528209 RepID=UPI0024A88629|nr:hypothetical protein [Secundilactobacillus kimchicus]